MVVGIIFVGGKVLFREGGIGWVGVLVNMFVLGEN